MIPRYSVLIVSVLCTAHVALAQTVRTIRLTTPDDVGISAAYYPVEGESAPAVVLLHTYKSNRDEWGAFPVLLQRNGIAALAIDLRGHGESIRKLTADGPQRVDFTRFTPRDFQDMLLDVNAAVDWLSDQPGINKQRIGIVGASVGANLALRYATFNNDLAAEALLSPGINYKEVRTDDAIRKIGSMPLRIVVSGSDSFSFESAKRLQEIRKETGHSVDTNELIICTGNLHGATMLTGVKELPTILLTWLKEVLFAPVPATPPPPPTPAPTPPPTNVAPSTATPPAK